MKWILLSPDVQRIIAARWVCLEQHSIWRVAFVVRLTAPFRAIDSVEELSGVRRSGGAGVIEWCPRHVFELCREELDRHVHQVFTFVRGLPLTPRLLAALLVFRITIENRDIGHRPLRYLGMP